MSANDARKPVALLARPGQARERLHQALDAAGASIVLEDDPGAVDAATLAAAAPQAVLVALEPAVEDALERLGEVLESPTLLVIFDEADLAARREGWEMQRWIRHLAAKLHGHGDVLPPGREQDDELGLALEPGLPPRPQDLHAQDRLEPYLAEAESLAAALPADDLPPLPATSAAPAATVPPPVPPQWELADSVLDEAPVRAPAAPPPLPDFSSLELVALESDTPAPAREPLVVPKVQGAVLVIAGIGGPDAVRKLLVALPRGFKRPVLIQLRLDGGRYDNLVKQMSRVSPLPVLMAEAGQELEPARVYVLPDDIGLEQGDGLKFRSANPGEELLEMLPPPESAAILLSGADPARVDAALALAARGAHVAGQALEGCYDATAVRQLAAGGIGLAPPAELAEQLARVW